MPPRDAPVRRPGSTTTRGAGASHRRRRPSAARCGGPAPVAPIEGVLGDLLSGAEAVEHGAAGETLLPQGAWMPHPKSARRFGHGVPAALSSAKSPDAENGKATQHNAKQLARRAFRSSAGESSTPPPRSAQVSGRPAVSQQAPTGKARSNRRSCANGSAACTGASGASGATVDRNRRYAGSSDRTCVVVVRAHAAGGPRCVACGPRATQGAHERRCRRDVTWCAHRAASRRQCDWLR